jgi:hypothetical protein
MWHNVGTARRFVSGRGYRVVHPMRILRQEIILGY